jgi:hypothetical protein
MFFRNRFYIRSLWNRPGGPGIEGVSSVLDRRDHIAWELLRATAKYLRSGRMRARLGKPQSEQNISPTRRPAHHPSVLLKLYICGCLNLSLAAGLNARLGATLR